MCTSAPLTRECTSIPVSCFSAPSFLFHGPCDYTRNTCASQDSLPIQGCLTGSLRSSCHLENLLPCTFTSSQAPGVSRQPSLWAQYHTHMRAFCLLWFQGTNVPGWLPDKGCLGGVKSEACLPETPDHVSRSMAHGKANKKLRWKHFPGRLKALSLSPGLSEARDTSEKSRIVLCSDL